MVYLWAFLALLLLVAVIVLATALFQAIAQREKLEREFTAAAAERKRLQTQIEQQSAEYDTAQSSIQRLSNAVRHYREKYGGVIDVEAEIAKLTVLLTDFEAKKRALEQIEEDLNSADVGLYKPQYDWNDSSRYRLALDSHYRNQKQFVKDGHATACDTSWSVRGSEKEGDKLTKDLTKLVLRAFNAECEAALGKVRWNNFEVMRNRILKAHETINKLVSRWKLRITVEYLNMWLEEPVLTHEYKEQQEKEREEQRRINEQIREEDKARREAERAQRDAEDTEARTQVALDVARRQLEAAHAEDAQKYSQKISELEAALALAQAEKERAVSMAELTRAGHIYIISNIGSFGDGVFKIGMTRRLDPTDRVRELGDASVPFTFDIHGMIYSEDAPGLESRLHRTFGSRRVNMVNERKEFFRVSIDEIVVACRELGVDIELTMLAEAKEYRQTMAMRSSSAKDARLSNQFAVTLKEPGLPAEASRTE